MHPQPDDAMMSCRGKKEGMALTLAEDIGREGQAGPCDDENECTAS